jgi:translation initiation factor 2 beta subunit (eIF-2beta)/eIF-5
MDMKSEEYSGWHSLVIVKHWKLAKCLSTEQKNKLWYTHKIDYYIALKMTIKLYSSRINFIIKKVSKKRQIAEECVFYIAIYIKLDTCKNYTLFRDTNRCKNYEKIKGNGK